MGSLIDIMRLHLSNLIILHRIPMSERITKSEKIAYIITRSGKQCVGRTDTHGKYVPICSPKPFINAFNKAICEIFDNHRLIFGTVTILKFASRPNEMVTLLIYIVSVCTNGICLVVHQTTCVGRRILFVCEDRVPSVLRLLSDTNIMAVETMLRNSMEHMKINPAGLKWHLK